MKKKSLLSWIFLFARKTLIFQKNDRQEWEHAKAVLSESGIRTRAGKYTPTAPQQYVISYVTGGNIDDITIEYLDNKIEANNAIINEQLANLKWKNIE